MEERNERKVSKYKEIKLNDKKVIINQLLLGLWICKKCDNVFQDDGYYCIVCKDLTDAILYQDWIIEKTNNKGK